ncbi:fatty acyl-AMP ligase [Hwanghaeella grinnelliae]|nr:fatty acyl-AMP ligase [Hwanghaeella grinnelliae]
MPESSESRPGLAHRYWDVLSKYADRTAITETFYKPVRSTRCGNLLQAARKVAFGLQQRTSPGARVLLCEPPGLEFAAGLLGCLFAGRLVAPCFEPTGRRTKARFDVIQNSFQPDLILARGKERRDFGWTTVKSLSMEGDWRRFEKSDIPDRMPDDAAIVQYTSGSISDPKGVVLTLGNIETNLDAIIAQVPLLEEDPLTTVTWLPPYHDLGLFSHLLTSMLVGGHLVVMRPIDFVRRPSDWLRYISEYKAGYSSAPDFAYALCVRRTEPEQLEGLDLSSWKTAINAAEPVRPETLDAFHALCKRIGLDPVALRLAYGLSEATVLVSVTPPGEFPPRLQLSRQALTNNRVEEAREAGDAVTLMSSGRVIPGTTLSIRDPENGVAVSEGMVGEICLDGPSIAKSYLDTPLEQPVRTGDLGFLNDGNLFITGRSRDLIILNGENYYPQDIEAAVNSVGDLERVCAFADDMDRITILCEKPRQTDDADLVGKGESICREVKKTTGLDVFNVSFVRANSLPLTSSGKLRRAEARKNFLDGLFDIHVSVTPYDRAGLATIDEFVSLVSEFATIRGKKADADTRLSDLGFDSLSLLQLGLRLEKDFGLYFRIEDIPQTVAELFEQIAPLSLRTVSSQPHSRDYQIDVRSAAATQETWRSIYQAFQGFMKFSELVSDRPNQLVHLCQAMESYFDLTPSQLLESVEAFQERQLYTEWFWYLPGLQRQLRDWESYLPADRARLIQVLQDIPPRSLIVLGHMHGWEWLLENILLIAHSEDMNLCLIGDVSEVEKLVLKAIGYRNAEHISQFRSAMIDVDDPQFAMHLTEAINAGKRIISLPDTVLAAHRLYHAEKVSFLGGQVPIASGVFKLAEAMESPVYQLDYRFNEEGLHLASVELEGPGYRPKMEQFAATIARNAGHWAQWQVLPKPEMPPEIDYAGRGTGFFDRHGIVVVHFGRMVLFHSLPNRRTVQLGLEKALPLLSEEGMGEEYPKDLAPLFIPRGR